MDAVAGLLDGPRARGAFLLRSQLDAPWSMRIADESPLCLIAVTRGHAWLIPENDEALLLRSGDVAVIRGPEPYTVADDPVTQPQVVVLPGQRCETPDGQEVKLMSFMGVRTWGNSPVGSTVMLNGTYELEGDVSRRLLGALPPLLVLPGDTPLLDPAEVGSLLAIPRAVSIVPDRHGTGTNALVLSPPDAIAPSFGPGSLKRHVAAAEAAGVASAVEELPTLMLDVDTGDDLAALQAALAERGNQAPATRAALDELERRRAQRAVPA